MTESNAALDHLARTDTVHLATTTQDGREIVTKIWAVVVDGQAYIRNAYGDSSHWHPRIVRNGAAAFIDGPNRYEVTAELVDDEDTNTKVDDGYSRKYGGSGSALRTVLTDDARLSTLHVIPIR